MSLKHNRFFIFSSLHLGKSRKDDAVLAVTPSLPVVFISFSFCVKKTLYFIIIIIIIIIIISSSSSSIIGKDHFKK